MIVRTQARKDKDLSWITKQKNKGFRCSYYRHQRSNGQLDIQGPLSQMILQHIAVDDLVPLRYYHAMSTRVMSFPAIVSRSGYTARMGLRYICEQ